MLMFPQGASDTLILIAYHLDSGVKGDPGLAVACCHREIVAGFLQITGIELRHALVRSCAELTDVCRRWPPT